MAKKKSFKSLPKKAQRAAFAQMDDDGTRRNKKPAKKSDGSPFSKTVKVGKSKLPHLKNDSDKQLFSATQSAFKSTSKNKQERERQISGLAYGIDRSKAALRSGEQKGKAAQTLRVARAFKKKNNL